MPKRNSKVSERELARRRAATESIDKRVQAIREHVRQAGPPAETITETLRRLRGGPKDGRA